MTFRKIICLDRNSTYGDSRMDVMYARKDVANQRRLRESQSRKLSKEAEMIKESINMRYVCMYVFS